MPLKDKSRIVSEVCGRVYSEIERRGEEAIERALLDGFYFEQMRLRKEPPSADRDREMQLWSRVQEEVIHGTPARQRALLQEVIRAHVNEIKGNFDERVYKVSTRMVPAALNLMLSAPNPRRLLRSFPRLPSLRDTFVVQGQKEQLKNLTRLGTVVLVPTHFSHLDSILVGYAIDLLGMEAFTYGAGLNLFTNPLMSYFMQNLGAYKVDRKKGHSVYKDVLKTYATVSIEEGEHNLFFPGGTRSRSGAVEEKLKKGLLGCGLSAYIHNLQTGRARPKVFIVPATLSYQLVLEAETLIEDFLKEVGKNRFIIEKDESSDIKKVAGFLKELVSLESRIYLTIGQALDPFGNPVDRDGISRDGRGRPIDISRYTFREGRPVEEDDRDRQFTNALADRIVDELHRCNVIQSTHLTAGAMWRLLRRVNKGMDLWRLLRTGGRELTFPLIDLLREVEVLMGEVEGLASAGRLMLDPVLRRGNEDRIVDDALRHFATYHTQPAMCLEGDRVRPRDLNLVYYYQHRLDGYGLA